jgi:hypothetical protein
MMSTGRESIIVRFALTAGPIHIVRFASTVPCQLDVRFASTVPSCQVVRVVQRMRRLLAFLCIRRNRIGLVKQ